jgi:hypothetical protein
VLPQLFSAPGFRALLQPTRLYFEDDALLADRLAVLEAILHRPVGIAKTLAASRDLEVSRRLECQAAVMQLLCASASICKVCVLLHLGTLLLS